MKPGSKQIIHEQEFSPDGERLLLTLPLLTLFRTLHLSQNFISLKNKRHHQVSNSLGQRLHQACQCLDVGFSWVRACKHPWGRYFLPHSGPGMQDGAEFEPVPAQRSPQTNLYEPDNFKMVQ